MDMGLKLKNRKVWLTAYIVYLILRFHLPLIPLLRLLYDGHDLSISHVLWFTFLIPLTGVLV